MYKLTGFLTLLIILCTETLIAQSLNVSGKVFSKENNEPLPGVAIQIKGTNSGSITDTNGSYSINVQTPETTLVFSLLGTDAQEVVLNGRTEIDVYLQSNMILDEVVITALGISRQKKSLGYSVASITADEISATKNPNFIGSMSGKVSGLNISQQSGTVGGAHRISIRGLSSLSDSNEPLFIVDGIELNNDYYGIGINGSVDYGNPIADINALNIENVNILKGASATALYGARGKNGAVIITTKKAQKGSTTITFNSTVRIDQVSKLPDYQNEYAQGDYGIYDRGSFNGWGPQISKETQNTYPDFLDDETTLKAYPNNVKNFFDTGVMSMNNIAIARADEKSDLRVSISNTYQKGIVPQSKYQKNDIFFNSGNTLKKWLEVRINGLYSRSHREGLSAQGLNDPNILIGNILTMPRTLNMTKVKENTYDAFNQQNSIDGDGRINNPYFILDNNKINSDVEHFVGAGTIIAKPTSWLSIKNQTGIDVSTQKRETVWSVGTFGEMNGKFKDNNYKSRLITNNLILSAQNSITPDITLNSMVGHNLYQREYERESNTVSDFIAEGLYTWKNGKTKSPTDFYSISRTYGFWAEASFDYKKNVFLTITGRNDYSSTLPQNNNSYFYPSVNVAYLFSENLTELNWLSFGKLRFNWANVGSDASPYQLLYEYSAQSTWRSQYNSGGVFPHANINAFAIPRILPNSNLKPQNKSGFEYGIDLALFNNRVMLNATYYNDQTDNQIMEVDLPLSSGFFSKVINAGSVENNGIEIDLTYFPIRNKELTWVTSFRFARNENKLLYLSNKKDDNEKFTLKSGFDGLSIVSMEGEAPGFYGTGWKRDDNGNFIINSETGLRETESDKYLGKIDPDFTLGFSNTIKYKNLTFSALIDWRQGGHMYSGTVANLRSKGLAKETLANRGVEYIEKGVNEVETDGLISYEENSTPVSNMQDYWAHRSSNTVSEESIFDASYMKLREITLTYEFPVQFLPSNFIKQCTIGIEARNLLTIIDNVPHVDPELSFLDPQTSSGAYEYNNVPLTRSYAFNINLKF